MPISKMDKVGKMETAVTAWHGRGSLYMYLCAIRAKLPAIAQIQGLDNQIKAPGFRPQ